MEITCQNDWYCHIEIALPLSHFLGYELLHMKTIREQYFFSSTFFQILPKIVQCLKPLEISSATGSKMKYFLFDLFRGLGQIIGLVLSCNCDKIIKDGLITVYWNKRGTAVWQRNI